jgi:magnesium-transporting ATPase (P-type)
VGAGARMLEATTVLELVLGKWLDAAVVGAVLVFDAGLGFVQQQRAAAALELINEDSPPELLSRTYRNRVQEP